jgi:hypothetical protein
MIKLKIIITINIELYPPADLGSNLIINFKLKSWVRLKNTKNVNTLNANSAKLSLSRIRIKQANQIKIPHKILNLSTITVGSNTEEGVLLLQSFLACVPKKIDMN